MVLQVNTHDIEGGAARAAYRIHEGLNSAERISRMLVQNKKSDDDTVVQVGQGAKDKIKSRVASLVDSRITGLYRNRQNVQWSVNFFGSSQAIEFMNNDDSSIIHFHWVNNGFISLDDMKKIKKPVVWTLHDTWAFTGGCHYFGQCSKYETGCYQCEQLPSRNDYDLSAFLFKKKQKVYSEMDITIVTPSNWLANCAKKSELMKHKRIEVIHNGLNLDVYRKYPKALARKIFDVAENDLVIMFGAMGSTGDKRKGYDYLKEALLKLNSQMDRKVNDKIKIFVFGASKPLKEDYLGYPIFYTGRVYDDVTLSLLYNCADVFVAPSREDNLPNTVVESLACGTPCVAFDIGGMSDMIDHKQNGYLVKAFDTDDLAYGIGYVLNQACHGENMSQNAWNKAKSNFNVIDISNKYKALYLDVLHK